MDKKKLFKNQYIIQISKHMVGTIANYTKMLREYIFATKKTNDLGGREFYVFYKKNP